MPDFPAPAKRIVLNLIVARFVEDRPDLADAFSLVGGELMVRAVALPQFALWCIAQGLGDATDFAKALDAVEEVRLRVHAEHLLASVGPVPQEV